MSMKNLDKPPYNSVPHYIAEDFRNGELKLNEMLMLLWLRAIGNPYGIAITSLSELKEDIFPDLKKNTVNTILLELRKKRYVFYEMRQGRKGSFNIHLNHWQMPKGGYKTLHKFFPDDNDQLGNQNNQEGKNNYPQANSSEASQKFEGQNQKLMEQKRSLANRFSMGGDTTEIRSYHNEHDNEKENKNELFGASFKGTLTNDFHPTNGEEIRCKVVAQELGEEYINPILGVLRTDGFWIIEKAWEVYETDTTNGKQITNPAAYFFGIVKRIRVKKQK